MSIFRRPLSTKTSFTVFNCNGDKDTPTPVPIWPGDSLTIGGAAGDPGMKIERHGDDFTVTLLKPFVVLDLDEACVRYYQRKLNPPPPPVVKEPGRAA